jgi:leader peptidase (prepilin peptidase)/N-methyltransferase
MSLAATTTTTAALAAAVALLVSPLLASWSAALSTDRELTWWRLRRPSWRRWTVVTALAVVLTVGATAGQPLPAWWLLAAGGTVLAVVDAERHLLPARFSYPLTAAVLLALTVAAVTDRSPYSLLRAVTALLVVAGVWFAAAFTSPQSVGLGDVRLAGLTAATLGWLGWPQVLLGQALTAVLAIVTAGAVAIARPQLRGRRMPIPMGPAMIGAAILACWL